MYRLFRLFGMVLFFIFLVSQPAQAADRFRFSYLRHAPDGGPFLTALQSYTVPDKQWTLGSALELQEDPLTLTNAAVVERALIQSFFGTRGFGDWFDVSVDLPVVWLNRFQDPATFGSTTNSQTDLGDLKLSSRILLVDRQSFPIGVAISPFLILPTGDSDNFSGEGYVSGGGLLIVDGQFQRLTWGFNLGADFHREFNAFGLKFQHLFTVTAALNYQFHSCWSAVGEFHTRTPFTDFFEANDTSPTEFRLGIQSKFGEHKQWLATLSGSYGVYYGTGAAQYGVMAGLTYRGPSWRTGYRSRRDLRRAMQKEVFFQYNQSRLTRSQKGELKHTKELLLKNPIIDEIRFTGYADTDGNDVYNQSLSKERAEVVRDYFIDGKEDTPVELNTKGVLVKKARKIEDARRVRIQIY